MELPSFLSSRRMAQAHRYPFHCNGARSRGIFVQARNVSVHDSFIPHSLLLKPTFFLLVSFLLSCLIFINDFVSIIENQGTTKERKDGLGLSETDLIS